MIIFEDVIQAFYNSRTLISTPESNRILGMLRIKEFQKTNKDTGNILGWLKDEGFDWPMPEEQEVEFKLRFM